MKIVRSCFIAAVIAALAGISIASAQSPTPATKPALESSTQVAKPPVSSKIKTWTRARWEAAKKRWAQNEAKFSDCQNKLREQSKHRKRSLHEQREFLYRCMHQKS